MPHVELTLVAFSRYCKLRNPLSAKAEGLAITLPQIMIVQSEERSVIGRTITVDWLAHAAAI